MFIAAVSQLPMYYNVENVWTFARYLNSAANQTRVFKLGTVSTLPAVAGTERSKVKVTGSQLAVW